MKMGITVVFLSSCFKANAGGMNVGYYLYNIGGLKQKSSICIMSGTKLEYIAATQAAHQTGLQLYVDIVVKHLAGADEAEKILARRVDFENRNEFISDGQ